MCSHNYSVCLVFYSSYSSRYPFLSSFFFFNAPPPTEIYTLSLHDALPISTHAGALPRSPELREMIFARAEGKPRSEEHTSELQSHHDLVCRLLLEKKKKKKNRIH